jgi:predicted lipase
MKALVGSWEQRPYRLLAEVTALRSRVRDLEQSLHRAQEENAALRAQAEGFRAITERAERTVVLTK